MKPLSKEEWEEYSVVFTTFDHITSTQNGNVATTTVAGCPVFSAVNVVMNLEAKSLQIYSGDTTILTLDKISMSEWTVSRDNFNAKVRREVVYWIVKEIESKTNFHVILDT